jgi:DNA-binding NarL/FixJ family response regulator
MGMVKGSTSNVIPFLKVATEAFLPVKVLLADDSEVIRRSIRRLLDREPHVQIVGEACDLAETLRLTRELQPQVLVMDLRMSSTSLAGSSTLRGHLQPTGRLLAISASNDEDSLSLARSLGADSFLDKMDLFEKLVPTILQLSSPHLPPANAHQPAS